MVNDLLARYDFHGWSTQEVQELLGEPDHDWLESGEHKIDYDLRDGLKRLIFDVDSKQRIVDYRVILED